MSRAQRLELIVILGALTAFAPLAIDMYLPALPALAQAFATSTDRVEFTLATFFLGFALGQGFYGPITDRFGRKPPLYASLALFAAMSAACALAPSVEVLALCRFLQALGACAGAVIARAMVRDVFPPEQTARIYSSLMLVMGVAPMAAPLVGGYLLVWLGWASIFWLLAILGLLCLLAVALRLPETHGGDAGAALRPGRVLGNYARLLGDRSFLGYALTGGLSSAGMFAYIAGSPFVFIELFQIAPERYGWLFGTNALGLIAASQLNARLLRRMGPDAVLGWAALVQAAAGLVLLVNATAHIGGLPGVALPLFAYVACVGLVSPNSTALAMAPHSRNAGVASALLGTLQFGVAALAAALVGALQNGTAVPMAGVIAGCGVLAVLVQRGSAAGRLAAKVS